MARPSLTPTQVDSSTWVGSWQQLSRRLWHDRWIYIFLLPTVVLYGTYTVWPILASYYYALLDWTGFERQGQFVGFANFRELFGDPQFWNAFRNTFVFLGPICSPKGNNCTLFGNRS